MSRHAGQASSAFRRGAAVALVLTFAACAKKEIAQGECRKLNGADVCTWAELSGNTVTAFGATVPMAAIEGAPKEAPMVWPPVAGATIPLPDAVASGTGFKVLTVYWEPHGHPPKPMSVPHWDFHFYSIPAAEVAAITCADTSKPAALAAGYALPDMDLGPPVGVLRGICVPGMGMHSLLATDLSDTTPWSKSMVLGYARRQHVFVEPMVANSTLLEKKSFTIDIPTVPGEAAGVHSPARFRADYDSTAKSYRFVFTDFNPAGAK